MQIDHLRLSQFRGFEALDLELHPRCTVLAGVNGSGKSSALDGLAVAIGSWLLGFDTVRPRSIAPAEVRRARFETAPGHADLEPQYPVRVEALGLVSGRPLGWARELRSAVGNTTYGAASELKDLARQAQQGVKKGDDVDLPLIAYYGARRLWSQKRASTKKQKGLSSRTLGYQDALAAESNHKLFEAWMRQRTQVRLQRLASSRRADAPDPLLDAVSKTAGEVVESGSVVRFDLATDELRFVYADGREQSFELLSDGYRNLVALAADLAWRSVRLNPHLGSDAPRQTAGVVLIDEIELHLHPAWQRTVVERLTSAFPKLQFVLTTHSPQILASVEAEQVRFLDQRGRVHRVGVSGGLDTNTVLRELMGVDERPKESAEALVRLGVLIEKGRVDEARKAFDSLRQRLGDMDRDLAGLEWELRDLEVHGAPD